MAFSSPMCVASLASDQSYNQASVHQMSITLYPAVLLLLHLQTIPYVNCYYKNILKKHLNNYYLRKKTEVEVVQCAFTYGYLFSLSWPFRILFSFLVGG